MRAHVMDGKLVWLPGFTSDPYA